MTGPLSMPAWLDSLRDHRLSGDPRLVYNWMITHLDLVERRCVKRDALAQLLGISAGSASRALELLVERGYLDARRDGRVTAYRLLWSRRSEHAVPRRETKEKATAGADTGDGEGAPPV